VVKEVVDDCFSVREVAVKHGIPAFGTVCNWLEKYRKYGEDAFIRHRNTLFIFSNESIFAIFSIFFKPVAYSTKGWYSVFYRY
ncbi:helix-turn-helix domain-containing protein, partial [Escherichia coli]|uniref:helix-turn-helix domain-containing protein n=1 Tax=Escherichia coli TaxID=562 RepID=UPI0030059072